jgi:hypothetical protein
MRITIAILFLFCLSSYGQAPVRTVDTVADLIALNPQPYAVGGKLTVTTLGYFAPGDGGGQEFRAVESGSTTNLGTVFASGRAGWQWHAVNWDGDVRKFGAKADGTTDDSASIQAAVDYARTKDGITYLPAGATGRKATYLVASPIRLYTQSQLLGGGRDTTIIRLAPGSNLGTNRAVIQSDLFENNVQTWIADIDNPVPGVIARARIENLTVDGSRETGSLSTGIALNGGPFILNKVSVINTGSHGIWTYSGTNGVSSTSGDIFDDWWRMHESSFTDIEIASPGGHGWLYEGPNDSWLHDIKIKTPRWAGFYQSGRGNGGSIQIGAMHAYTGGGGVDHWDGLPIPDEEYPDSTMFLFASSAHIDFLYVDHHTGLYGAIFRANSMLVDRVHILHPNQFQDRESVGLWIAGQSISINSINYATRSWQWAPNTAYTTGTRRTWNGNAYTVTSPGTSGTEGPSGYRDVPTDGTVTWEYASPAPPRVAVLISGNRTQIGKSYISHFGDYAGQPISFWVNPTLYGAQIDAYTLSVAGGRAVGGLFRGEGLDIKIHADLMRVGAVIEESTSSSYEVIANKADDVAMLNIGTSTHNRANKFSVRHNRSNSSADLARTTYHGTRIPRFRNSLELLDSDYRNSSIYDAGDVLTNIAYTARSPWAATTVYSLNDVRTNSLGSIYRATIAGTSSSSEPTHTTGTASDGSVTWKWVGDEYAALQLTGGVQSDGWYTGQWVWFNDRQIRKVVDYDGQSRIARFDVPYWRQPNETNTFWIEPVKRVHTGALQALPTPIDWNASTAVAVGDILQTTNASPFRWYKVLVSGTTGGSAPTSESASVANGTSTLKFLGQLNRLFKLAETASAIDSFYVGNRTLNLTFGTGIGQSRVITHYDGETRIGSGVDNWFVTPGTASYFISSSFYGNPGHNNAGVVSGRTMSFLSDTAFTDATLTAVDADVRSHYVVSLGGNLTVPSPDPAPQGSQLIFQFRQSGSGGYSITWPADYVTSYSNDGNDVGTHATVGFIFNGKTWQETSVTPWQ